nr:unnamed protein product [Callosobruchus analis]
MYKWTHQNTLLLLDLYKKYKTMVTEGRIRLKKLYECIANEIKVKTRENVTAANCENRWKVLERNFKKYCDNNKKTGRGKIFFEYADIMEDILQTKKNVHPVLLLSTETVQELDISGRVSGWWSSKKAHHKLPKLLCIGSTHRYVLSKKPKPIKAENLNVLCSKKSETIEENFIVKCWILKEIN